MDINMDSVRQNLRQNLWKLRKPQQSHSEWFHSVTSTCHCQFIYMYVPVALVYEVPTCSFLLYSTLYVYFHPRDQVFSCFGWRKMLLVSLVPAKSLIQGLTACRCKGVVESRQVEIYIVGRYCSSNGKFWLLLSISFSYIFLSL